MSAKLISVEGSGTTIATQTVYTVPASRAARVRCAWQFKAGAGNSDVTITYGNQTLCKIRIGNGLYCYTAQEVLNPPGFGIIRNNDATPLYDVSAANLLIPNWIGAPLFQELFLAAGQTIAYAVATTALNAAAFKVMGVEDDA